MFIKFLGEFLWESSFTIAQKNDNKKRGKIYMN